MVYSPKIKKFYLPVRVNNKGHPYEVYVDSHHNYGCDGP